MARAPPPGADRCAPPLSPWFSWFPDGVCVEECVKARRFSVKHVKFVTP